MFQLFKKDYDLYAPVNGSCIQLEDVPDQVFASKMMGDGVAFMLNGDTVFAPCDGKIEMIANTLHAFAIKAKNGAEILVHVGLDTVNLNGAGFTKLVQQGTNVKKGTPILKIDCQFMKENNIKLITPMIILNHQELKYEMIQVKDVTAVETKVIHFV